MEKQNEIRNISTVPEKAITTHPAIVRAMIRQVKKAGGIPQVGDCSVYEGRPNYSRYITACHNTGILKVCEEEGAEILHLSAESVEVKNPDACIYKSFILSGQVQVRKQCKKCWICIEHCPSGALSKKGEYPLLITRNVSDATAVRNYVQVMPLN